MNVLQDYELDEGSTKSWTGVASEEEVETDFIGKVAGSDWTNRLNVYEDVGDGTKKSEVHIIPHEMLEKELETIIDTNEEILNIELYNHRLSRLQPKFTDKVFYHNLVFLKTNKWYWTIEKTSECILVQRSKQKKAIIERAICEKRNTPINLEKKCSARGNVFDIIDWLYRNNELTRTYNLFSDNCQQFANRFCDFLTTWINEIYFYRDVGSGSSRFSVIRVPYADLPDSFEKLIDMEAPIDKVYMYKHELPDSQRTDDKKYYYYLLCKSGDWYWTIEKNSKYIIVQRSENRESVKSSVQGFSRSDKLFRVRHEDDNYVQYLGELIEWMHRILTLPNIEGNDIVTTNSEAFVNQAYDYLTRGSSRLVFHKYFNGNMVHFTQHLFDDTTEKSVSLKKKIGQYADIDKAIKKVSLYKHKLPDSQEVQEVQAGCEYHYFVLFVSEDDMYWTIEKHSTCILLQMGDESTHIRESVFGDIRNSLIESECHDIGKIDIKYLLDWLCQEKKIVRPPTKSSSNSEVFANRVYECIRKMKTDLVI